MFDIVELAAETPPAWGQLDDDELEALIAELTAEAEAELAATLESVDVGRLVGFDRVVVLRAHARMAAHFQAQVYAHMASITEAMRGLYGDAVDACESAAAEISVALNLTRRAADDELAMALDLIERLPAVWERLAAGDIDRRRARTLVMAPTISPPPQPARRRARCSNTPPSSPPARSPHACAASAWRSIPTTGRVATKTQSSVAE